MTDAQIPRHWQGTAEHSSRSALLQARRRLQLPDLSYDLDGDGIVDGKDFFLARQFDETGSGKLSAAEQARARTALHHNFDSAYVWGCEASGPNRSFRTLQKRGVTILGEDFTPVATTYPAMPVTTPQVHTRQELLQRRRTQTLSDNADLMSKLIRDFRTEVPIEALVDYTQYNPQPTYKSRSHKQVENKRQARTAAGLTEPTDLTAAAELPLQYNARPPFSTAQEMKSHRKSELVGGYLGVLSQQFS